MGILKLTSDTRRGEPKSVIFCPVGDEKQFEEFQDRMEKQGIAEDRNIDFLFITKKGMNLKKDCRLCGMIFEEDDVKSGTSGCFFMGQFQAYMLGYKHIIIADLDAELDSKKSLDDMIGMADGKIVVPLSTSKTTVEKPRFYNTNQWGVFPREMFDKYGFATPYFFKGSEDYDQICRVKKDVIVDREALVLHPKTGYTVYHKMTDKRKFYPYLGSLMKDFLLLKKYPQYMAWYLYYSFFADIFQDQQLRRLMQRSNDMKELWQDFVNEDVKVRIETIKVQGTSNSKFEMISSIFASLFSFLMNRPFDVYTDRVHLTMSRMELMKRMIWASLLIPVRASEGVWKIVSFRKEVPYPVYVQDVPMAIDWMLNAFPRND